VLFTASQHLTSFLFPFPFSTSSRRRAPSLQHFLQLWIRIPTPFGNQRLQLLHQTTIQWQQPKIKIFHTWARAGDPVFAKNYAPFSKRSLAPNFDHSPRFNRLQDHPLTLDRLSSHAMIPGNRREPAWCGRRALPRICPLQISSWGEV
jgi:hypothetical protein